MSGTRRTILLYSAGTYGGTTFGTNCILLSRPVGFFLKPVIAVARVVQFFFVANSSWVFIPRFHEILVHYNLIVSTAIGIAHFFTDWVLFANFVAVCWFWYTVLGQHAGSTAEQALIPAKYDTRADTSESQPNSLCNKLLPATTSSRNVGSHTTDHAS